MSDEYLVENFTTVTFKFKSIRVVDSIITAHVSTLKAEMMLPEEVSDIGVTIALEKIHFWFDQIVPHCVMFCRSNQNAMDMLFDENSAPRTENFPMVFPDEPTDDVVAVVFHSKINALAEGQMFFGMVEIQSDTREMITYSFNGLCEEALMQMDEWVGARAYHTKPWWARPDGDTLDVIPTPDSDLTNPPRVGMDLSFIDSKFKRNASDTTIIIRPQFTPEVISGGKDDKPKG